MSISFYGPGLEKRRPFINPKQFNHSLGLSHLIVFILGHWTLSLLCQLYYLSHHTRPKQSFCKTILILTIVSGSTQLIRRWPSRFAIQTRNVKSAEVRDKKSPIRILVVRKRNWIQFLASLHFKPYILKLICKTIAVTNKKFLLYNKILIDIRACITSPNSVSQLIW